MRLSWNEIRPRAAEFARKWADAGYEKGETQSFYNAFFRIFGVERRSVARYEEHVKRLDDSQGFIDLFWPGVLLVEQKSAGRDLAAARRQALSYFDALKEHERPRYLLLCDFRNFELLDLDEGEEARFTLAASTATCSRNFCRSPSSTPGGARPCWTPAASTGPRSRRRSSGRSSSRSWNRRSSGSRAATIRRRRTS